MLSVIMLSVVAPYFPPFFSLVASRRRWIRTSNLGDMRQSFDHNAAATGQNMLYQGAQKLTGENLKVVMAEFSTLS
jgi:hypothetical protein